jgi:hypothetical protein
MTTRRAHLAALGLAGAALPLAALPLAASTAWGADAAPPLRLTATRTQISLPALPSVGVTYIATFDLADADGQPVGTAWSSSAVVDVNLEGPVVLGVIVLRLTDGEIHYQRVINRFGDYPRTSTGAILGGTGTYNAAAGTVDVSWPDPDTISLVVNLNAPAAPADQSPSPSPSS